MKCEACGYKFLFASSTKCPSCGDPREDIVKESDIQAAMEESIKPPVAAEPWLHESVYDALRACTHTVVGPWKEPDDGVFVWGNSPSNVHTEPQDAAKRPFEQVAGIVAAPSSKDECATGEFMSDLPVSYYVCWYEERPHNGSNKAEYASFRHAFSRFNSLNTVDGVKDVGIYVSGPQTIRVLADGKISGLQIEHYGIPESDLCKAGWVPTGPNEDAWVSPWHTEEPESDWTLQPMIPWTSPAPIMNSIVGLKAANAHLTRQLAAQALAHAEQMEGLKADREKARRENVALGDLYATATVRTSELETEVANWQDAWAKERDFWRAQMQHQLSAMRVAPATQPTDAQQTASDVKVAPERRPDGTLKPAAKAWEAPKQASDARRIGS